MAEPYRPRYTWRMGLSDAARSGVLGPFLSGLDSLTGNRARGVSDRVFGAGNDRAQNEYNSYMRDLMRGDPGYSSGQQSRFRNPFQRSPQGQPLPAWMQPGAPMPQQPTPQFNPSYPWDQPRQVNDLYGQGQGMMRGPAPNVDRGTATLARGEAAVDYARRLAQHQTGLNATSEGWRTLNQRARGMAQ